MNRVAWLILLVVSSSQTPALTQELFWPTGHDLEGLPRDDGVQSIYGDDPQSSLNRLHRLLYTANYIPQEIQGELPAERRQSGVDDSEFFKPGWYFQKRKGEPSDKKTFGGDVRVSPRFEFESSERELLKDILAAIANRSDQSIETSLKNPVLSVLVHWDLLSIWWSLEKAKIEDEELLEQFALAIERTAIPKEKTSTLVSGLEELQSRFSSELVASTDKPYLPNDFSMTNQPDNPWVEIGRRSSTLFRADRSLRMARVFLRTGTRESAIELLDAANDDSARSQPIPNGTQTVLVQQLIVLDEHLQPYVTPLVDEFRVRVMTGPPELHPGNRSSSRDGSSHWIFMRTRYGSIRSGIDDFRFVPDTSQSLFIEYGTRKHATFAAQCALCHRRTNSGGDFGEGIRSLSKFAKPHVAQLLERENLAIQEMEPVTKALLSRLAAAQEQKKNRSDLKPPKQPASPAMEMESTNQRPKPRPARSDEERRSWVNQLREKYSRSLSDWPEPMVESTVKWQEIGTLPPVPHPDDNPYSKEKEALGKLLFFEPRLSGSEQIACASCHDPDLGWADGRTTSFGHSRTLLARNAPTIRNTGHFSKLFWDGRANSLEDQVIQVLKNPNEMHSSEPLIQSFLSQNAVYQEKFVEAFGDSLASMERVAKAIACYERTVVGGSSRFDLFIKGKRDSFSDSELIGMDLFRRDARCMNCHHGPLFSDGAFHNVGLSYYGRRFQDLGRYEITHDPKDVGRFKTPSLRDITRSTPLMHNGLFELSGVLNMYNAGMPTLRRNDSQTEDPLFPTKSDLLKPLGLNQQDLNDLAAFLKTLEEPKRRIEPPRLPDSEQTLSSGSP